MPSQGERERDRERERYGGGGGGGEREREIERERWEGGRGVERQSDVGHHHQLSDGVDSSCCVRLPYNSHRTAFSSAFQ